MTHDDDRAWMERAITLGRKARYWSAPNPAVGCVLLRDGVVLGEGFTQPAGSAHAEIMALQSARDVHGPDSVAGATAFVTLEPCSHEGRTGPCVEALIEARIKRAVVAIEDPNPAVSGQGLSALRDAGIAVELGICAEQVEQDLAGFLCACVAVTAASPSSWRPLSMVALPWPRERVSGLRVHRRAKTCSDCVRKRTLLLRASVLCSRMTVG